MTSLLTTHCRRQVAIFFRKMAFVASSSSIMLALAFLAVFFSSVSPGSAIKCWECNSQYDMRCGEPFDNYTVALVDCDQRRDKVDHIDNEMLVKYNEYTVDEQAVENFDAKKASVCRKTTQIVGENTRVIRGCGWIRNTGYLSDRKCFMRTGTHQVLVYHCSCKSDGCNPASRPAALSTSIIALLTVTLPLLPSCLFTNNLWEPVWARTPSPFAESRRAHHHLLLSVFERCISDKSECGFRAHETERVNEIAVSQWKNESWCKYYLPHNETAFICPKGNI